MAAKDAFHDRLMAFNKSAIDARLEEIQRVGLIPLCMKSQAVTQMEVNNQQFVQWMLLGNACPLRPAAFDQCR